MKVLGKVFPLEKSAKKYGEFGLKVSLEPSEFIKLKLVLESQSQIQLAFGYFAPEHLQEVVQSDGTCTLTAFWEKGDQCQRNDGELWDDAKFLEDWLQRATWHGIHYQLGLCLFVKYYKPMCDQIADGEAELDDCDNAALCSDPRNFEWCNVYEIDGSVMENNHYETITDSLGVDWSETRVWIHKQ